MSIKDNEFSSNKIFKMKNNNKKTEKEIVGGFIETGNTTEEKISSLQGIKDAMTNCMMLGLSDDLALDQGTAVWLQNIYLQANFQIQKLQKTKFLSLKN